MKVIVFEGLDGSGKETQANKLEQFLRSTRPYSEHPIHRFSFPNYGTEQAALEEMYLRGRIHENPNDVNPYAASMMYALDRYITLEKIDIEKDAFVIFDRYTSSNLVFQGPKIKAFDENGCLTDEIKSFAEYITEAEHEWFKIPKPDTILFLNVHPEVAAARAKDRATSSGKEIDIHETEEFQRQANTAAKKLLNYAYKSSFCDIDTYYERYNDGREDYDITYLNEDEVFVQVLRHLFLDNILYNPYS